MDLAGSTRRRRRALVFLVGADGNIIERWDNVATEVRLVGAVEALVGR
jgi:hypothetical protein